LRKVDRVISDLRRGGIVVVTGGAQSLAAQAAENVTAESLAQLAKLGGGKLVLALTRRRGD
jgi:3,4-dihydroxy-2-butanone 4-phosphate synthase